MANTYTAAIDSDYNAAVPNYNALVNKVYDWSNRDAQALPAQIVKDSIRYAVDKAYRTLRIPPLEHTVTWSNFPQVYRIDSHLRSDPDGMATVGDNQSIADQATLDALIASVASHNEDSTQNTIQTLVQVMAGPLERATIGATNIYQSTTALAVPGDLIEFIHIRGRDDQGLTTRVFNEKSDIRSYWDLNNRHYEQTAFWSRQGNKIVLTPAIGRIGRGFYGGIGGPETQIEMYYYRRLPALDAVFDSTSMLTGEVPNWFKDENEKIALYGALAECFAYLQEDDQAGKYTQLMQQEIAELNEEDRMRDSSGGNIQTQYTANGLI